MADVNYNNPGAMNPGQAWQPQGFLGGMLYDDQMRNYRDMASLQKYGMGMEAVKNTAGLQDYMSARPSALEATIATNRATSNNVGEQRRGEAERLTLANQEKRGTMESDIRTKNTENDSKTMEKNIEHLDTLSNFLEDLSSKGPEGRAAADHLWKTQFMSHMPPEAIKQMPPEAMNYQPGVSNKILAQMKQHMIDSIAQKQKMEAQKAHDDAEYKKATDVANISGQYRVEAATGRNKIENLTENKDRVRIFEAISKMGPGAENDPQNEPVLQKGAMYYSQQKAGQLSKLQTTLAPMFAAGGQIASNANDILSDVAQSYDASMPQALKAYVAKIKAKQDADHPNYERMTPDQLRRSKPKSQ